LREIFARIGSDCGKAIDAIAGASMPESLRESPSNSRNDFFGTQLAYQFEHISAVSDNLWLFAYFRKRNANTRP
jgi:hypothetical protein